MYDTIASTQISAVCKFHFFSLSNLILWCSFQLSFLLNITIYQSLTPQGNRAGPGVDRDTPPPQSLCTAKSWLHSSVLCPEKGCKALLLPISTILLPYCSAIIYPWWNAIQLNHPFCAQTSTAKEMSQKCKDLYTIHSKYLKSNDPSSLPENSFCISSSISRFL